MRQVSVYEWKGLLLYITGALSSYRTPIDVTFDTVAVGCAEVLQRVPSEMSQEIDGQVVADVSEEPRVK